MKNSQFAGCTLYLKLVFEEARRWRCSERKELSPTVEDMILDMFRRLSLNENYGEMFSRSMGYLAAAKNGLTEDELLDVLSLDSDFLTSLRRVLLIMSYLGIVCRLLSGHAYTLI